MPGCFADRRADSHDFQSPSGSSCLLLNRNSDNILRDLKKTLRRPEEKLTAEEVDQLGVLWNPDLNYSFMYRFVLDVCKYLDVTVPAIFFLFENDGSVF